MAQHKSAEQFTLHPILKKRAIIVVIQSVSGFRLGSIDGCDAVIRQKFGHNPVGHDHQFGNQQSTRAFSICFSEIKLACLNR